MEIDRPALSEEEIKVTPEMIEAGREEIAKVWTEFVSLSGVDMWPELLTDVYRAMTLKTRLTTSE